NVTDAWLVPDPDGRSRSTSRRDLPQHTFDIGTANHRKVTAGKAVIRVRLQLERGQ
ncbi:hypothetical protein quinque_016415, partial [Culex quinquefasciatus]